MVAHPRAAWMPERHGADGRRLLDVLIVGAGQGGLALAFQLGRDRVDNFLLIDRAAEGREGPWRTYARMRSLRSPKEYTGPDLGIPSLTYEAWHTARYGRKSWQALALIATEDWAAYLDWYRRTLELPVRNETELVRIEPAEGHLWAHLRGKHGDEVLAVRKIVLATGQDGLGRWWTPPIIEALPRELWANAAEDIDFARLAGKRVAVLGAGASAADNAATALEAGAVEVRLLCRRPELQLVQPYRWLTFTGFLRHMGEMDDAWRWRFMSRILGMREGIPAQTYRRMAGHAGFTLLTRAELQGAEAAGGALRLRTAAGAFESDFVIAATGIDIDPGLRPELAGFADRIARWSDRYTPPPEEADARLGRYPYLGPNQELTEREPGTAPFLKDIHDFTIAATMSLGPSGCSINAMSIAVPRLASAITRGLFAADIETHYASLLAYDEPMFRLEEMDRPRR
jgi:FAD-dependent urate hydroxylase